AGADPEQVMKAMARRLSPAVVALGTVRDAGSRDAQAVAFGGDDHAHVAALTEVLADRDQTIMSAYVGEDAGLTYERLRDALRIQTRAAAVHPVFFGSAVHDLGVRELLAGLEDLLPRPSGDAEGLVSGRVFKIERS